ncbi:response regulator transcription factor [Pseudonocardia petroleophila]|uniref:Response regulator transcription factor n=1 Tax=Pseudonocardia petroleophila TaxID=37331 RepID=A0A7G7MD02_9PSEU|nr:response regulator transcription factor [Pseudonocardia petroleophila]QNG50663.1 response regulator transcription factor [Pseudonocardia petroleophila]
MLAVFLVDDHRVFTELLAMGLDAQPDLRCAGTAHSVAEAVEQARTLAFDVAVVDLQMPDGGGLTAIPRLRELRPAARIVVLTAHPRPELVRLARRAGAAAVLAKDAPLAEILDAVRAPADGPAAPPEPTPAARLTPRELQVLVELGRGRDATRIAAALGISVHTTRDHIRAVLAKLGVHTQLDAVVTADRLGIVLVGGGC